MLRDLFDDSVGEIIGVGNGQIVLRDFPVSADANEDTGSTAGSEVGGVQHFVEPGGLAVGGEVDVAVVSLEVPRGLLLEVGLGPGVELGRRPAFGGVGSHKD